MNGASRPIRLPELPSLNQDRLLDGIKLEVTEVEGSALGMVPVDSPYKASVIFADAFKPLVESVLGSANL